MQESWEYRPVVVSLIVGELLVFEREDWVRVSQVGRFSRWQDVKAGGGQHDAFPSMHMSALETRPARLCDQRAGTAISHDSRCDKSR